MAVQMQCPKCQAYSGDSWAQCVGACPVQGSPYFRPEQQRKYGGLRPVEDPAPSGPGQTQSEVEPDGH